MIMQEPIHGPPVSFLTPLIKKKSYTMHVNDGKGEGDWTSPLML